MDRPAPPRDSSGRIALGRRDIASVLAEWTEMERYELCRRWVERYLTLWHVAYPRYADAVGIAEAKRVLHTQRMMELVDRAQQIRDGPRSLRRRRGLLAASDLRAPTGQRPGPARNGRRRTDPGP